MASTRGKEDEVPEDQDKDECVSAPCVIFSDKFFVTSQKFMLLNTSLFQLFYVMGNVYLICSIPLLKENVNKFYGFQ